MNHTQTQPPNQASSGVYAFNPGASHRSLARIALAAAVLVLAAVAFSIPGESAWLPGCIFYKLTGLYCPGCGTTRMLFYLVHGHPIQAFRSNPLTLFVLPLVLYSLIRNSFALKLPALPTIPGPWVVAVAVAVVLFAVARNIPAEPFRKLAPGGLTPTGAQEFKPSSLRESSAT